MIDIREIGSSDLKNERLLLLMYAQECSIAAIGNPNPQWDIYEQLEMAGAMNMLGAFHGGRMVGFASELCSINPHYGVKLATTESIFVGRQYRSYGAGTMLMRAVEQHATTQGCKAILYSAPAGGKLEAVLGRHYDRSNSVWCKSLA